MEPTPAFPPLTPLGPEKMARLKGRVFINPPDIGFDPLTADDDTLNRHRLPPRPNGATARLALENWETALSGKPRFVGKVESFGGGARSLTRLATFSNAPHESSRNWSGSYVRPRDFGRMALVQGRWTVPEPRSPRPHRHEVYGSSTWVGLDGRDPASRSLPQIGTGQYFSHRPGRNPEPVVFAWWQWWDRDDPDSQQVTLDAFLPISAGDTVYAQVQSLPPATLKESAGPVVSLLIRNETTNLAFAAYVTPPSPPRPVAAYEPIEGRTADWIVERPAVPSQPVLTYYPFADFTEATFTDRHAAVQEGSLLHDIPLDRGRLIRMNAWDDPHWPGREVSTPSLSEGRATGQNLTLRYVPAP